MKIFISAGEVSGDVHASFLVKEIKKLRPDISFLGVGSVRLAAEGVDVRFDISRRGTIGIFEAVPNVLPIFLTFQKVKQTILKEKPDLVLLVDSQGFNMPLARFCKKAGIKTAYYIAPQEWLWGSPQGVKKAAESLGLIISIFEKEHRIYKEAGANSVYFGHPLLDIVKPSQAREEARRKLVGADVSPSVPVVALCPGSRLQEIRGLFPILLRAAKKIKEKLPDSRFIIPVASAKIIREIFDLIGEDFRPKAIVGETYNIISAADLAICSSGTINLEASILGVPNIMVYKLSLPTYLIGKYILKIDKKIPYFSMPNILLDKKVVPELVMGEANPEKIASESLSYLNDQEKMIRARLNFNELRALLGKNGVLSKAAEAILSFTGQL